MLKTAFILPEPDVKLKVHSEQLSLRILRRIRQQGPISFHDYMEMALYEPGLGYYSAGMAKLGAGGDFITAPELGAVFARCLANTITAAAQSLASYSILELGAGSGALAADLLDALADKPPAKYLILERSADLAERQRRLLEERHSEYISRIQWIQEPPADFNGIILGNEIVDALPVERFVIQDGTICQSMISSEDDTLVETRRPAPDELSAMICNAFSADPAMLNSPYQSEINTYLDAWLLGISEGLHSGLIILSDYGYPRSDYYHEERNRGTLLCHYRHRAHDDALFWPGLQDITASVDFTALAGASEAAGLDLLAYTSQSGYLIDAGLMDVIADLEDMDERARLECANEVKQLTLPSEMGERFQFMIMGRNMPADLPGMNGPDLFYRL